MTKALVVAAAVVLAAAALAYQDGNCFIVLTDSQVKAAGAAAGKTVTINLTAAQIEHLRAYYPNAKVSKITLTSADVGKGGRVNYVPPAEGATVLKARGGG
jgi:hypothetical protein